MFDHEIMVKIASIATTQNIYHSCLVLIFLSRISLLIFKAGSLRQAEHGWMLNYFKIVKYVKTVAVRKPIDILVSITLVINAFPQNNRTIWSRTSTRHPDHTTMSYELESIRTDGAEDAISDSQH